MSVKQVNYKNTEFKDRYQESRNIQFHNPIYQKILNIGCPFCKKDKRKGRKKIYQNLYCLYMHFIHYHRDEKTGKELVQSLADLVIRGVLL